MSCATTLLLIFEPKKGSQHPFGSNCFEYRVCFYLFLSFWSENASMLSLFANTEMSYVCRVPRVHHRVQASLCAWSANRQDCGEIWDGYQVSMSYIGKKIERMTGQISEWLVKSVIGPKWLCHRINIAPSFHWYNHSWSNALDPRSLLKRSFLLIALESPSQL